jgi:hypothetical protein
LLLWSLLAAGCSAAAPRGEGTCLSCDDHRLVRIVSVEDQASVADRRFDHPLTLDRHEWEAVVRGVHVQNIRQPLLGPSYRGATEQAFTDEDVLYLGAALQRAFQEATAQQRVVFALTGTSDAGLSQLTSGAWFVEQGRIHLQLANYRVTVTMPSIRRQIWNDPMFAQAPAFYELVPGDHQSMVMPADGGGHPFRPSPAELAIEYGTLTGHGSQPASMASPGAAPSTSSSSLEDRLGQLKRLYEQGLITEDDYRTKKQQLLDRL